MRIATRLVLVLVAALALVIFGYAAFTLRRGEALLRASITRETDTLARTLHAAVSRSAAGNGYGAIADLLAAVAREPEIHAALLVGPRGQALAGEVHGSQACLEPILAEWRAAPGAMTGWAECGEPVRWALLPLDADDGLLLVRRAALIAEHIAAERRQLLLLALALTAASALGVVVVLRRSLVEPLQSILDGVRVLGGPHRQPVPVPRAAGELHTLAEAVNRMGEQLETRRLALRRQTEERIAAENRLHAAETFAVAGRLTGSLIHEIGSPLAIIAMHADALAAQADASPGTRAQLEDIQAELDRISELVDGLRRIVQRSELPLAPLDVAEVVRAALADIEARCRAAQVEIADRIPRWPVGVRGHRTLLRHAVFNLLNNAVQALSTKGAGERRLWVVVERTTATVRVVIEDSGPGLSAEQLKRLFDPFFTTKADEGSGLGLVISRSIAEEHGGSLYVEAREGGGARAVLTLPAPPHSTPAPS